MTKEELLQAIGEMTVLELADLVKALEEKFGVTAAMPIPVTMPDVRTRVEREEQTEFDVILTAIGEQKIQVIKTVRALTSLGLREAKSVVDEAPSEVLRAVSKTVAIAAKEKLALVGASSEVR